MKKLIVVLAILSFSGIAFGAGIPMVVDPENFPEVWTQEVYNNSGAAITSGTVVVWDFDAATTAGTYYNRRMYVTTSATADDVKVAGVVVDNSIPASSVGTIAIYGPVYTLAAQASDACVVDTSVACANGVTGQAGDATGAADTGNLGYCIKASGNTIANGGFGGGGAADFTMIPIFVNPNCQ